MGFLNSFWNCFSKPLFTRLIDASHHGGNPGFVHMMNESRLVWPDYAGNMMFQALGNIAVNPVLGCCS
jgi:hypothetical protein